MTAEEFRNDLEAEIQNSNSNFGQGLSTAFAENITKKLQDAEYLNGEFQEAFFKGTHPKRKSNMRVDGWAQDDTYNSIALFIVHYDNGDGNMTKLSAEKHFKMLESFADAVLTTDIDIEESTSVAELAETLRTNTDAKFKFILLTNLRRSATLHDIKKFSVRNKEVETQIWDIERIFTVYNSLQVREPVEINFTEYGRGLPCLRATTAGDDCESFLCVMPGKILADIYDEYGSRLLEGNVRSFLSTKRSVNKNIRTTILNEPEKFFAFNNGIAVTAKQVELETFGGGTFITKVTDFQIINGGQTTAVLLSAKLRDKVSLEKIFVQMKLTRISDMPTDAQDELIRKISESSNSQNKIDAADFFSTHKFHVEMEKISRRIYAPDHEIQSQTKWFYERARGQYLQEQMKMTPTQKKHFQRENPKSQVFSKTDFAKFRMSWQEHPDIVSKGAQANFKSFADEIEAAWKTNPAQFNEHYFKETAALAIIFHAVEKIVSDQSWYQQTKSYRANIVTYSLAIFHHALKKKFPDAELNLLAVWKAQKFPDEWRQIFEAITLAVNNFITGKRPINNVTQWCKRADCWTGMKNSLQVELPESFSRWLIDAKELKRLRGDSEEIQSTSFEVDAQRKILSFSGLTWQKIRDDARRKNLLAADESKALATAIKIPERIPQPFQCEKLLRLLERLEENGLTYATDTEP